MSIFGYFPHARGSRRLLVAAALAWLAFGLVAEPPLAVAKAKSTRARLVADAEVYLGVPYLYGGTDTKGLDCSGLVYRVYRDVLGQIIPRTAKTLFAFCEPVERSKLQPGDLVFFDTTDRLAHVGIFVGEGQFIHAASEGPRTGVLRSSLTEDYWQRTYAGAGRLITPAGYLGFILGLAGGPQFGADSLFRGLGGSATLAWPIAGLEPGLQVQASWDAELGVLRLPLQLSFGIDRRLRFYGGPVLTLGSPALSGGAISYVAAGGWLGTLGLSYAPFTFKAGGLDWRLVGNLSYDRYVAPAGTPADAGRDLAAGFRAGIFIETRVLL